MKAQKMIGSSGSEESLAIEIKSLNKSFSGYPALSNIEMKVPEGGVFCIAGPNGAGKTTLLKTAAGFLRPTSGCCLTLGVKMPSRVLYRDYRVGVIFQENYFYSELTAGENMEFYAMSRGIYGKSAKEVSGSLLSTVGLAEDSGRKAGDFSGGMKRRLSIAVALIGDPELIIMDEPTAGLDLEGKSLMWKLLNDMKNCNKTIFLATHDLKEAVEKADTIALLNRGALMELLENSEIDKIHNTKKVEIEYKPSLKKELIDAMSKKGYSAEEAGGSIEVTVHLDDKVLNSIKETIEDYGSIASINEVTIEEIFSKRFG